MKKQNYIMPQIYVPLPKELHQSILIRSLNRVPVFQIQCNLMTLDSFAVKTSTALKPSNQPAMIYIWKQFAKIVGPIYKIIQGETLESHQFPSLKTLSTALRCRPFTFQDTSDEPRIGLRIQAMVGHQQEDRHSLAIKFQPARNVSNDLQRSQEWSTHKLQ